MLRLMSKYWRGSSLKRESLRHAALHPTLTHESAVADPRHHQPQALQLTVGPADGADGYPQIVGKHPMGRQFSSGSIKPSRIPLHDIGQAFVLDALPVGQPSRIIDTMSIFVLTVIFG
jgi:hypothetical protein